MMPWSIDFALVVLYLLMLKVQGNVAISKFDFFKLFNPGRVKCNKFPIKFHYVNVSFFVYRP